MPQSNNQEPQQKTKSSNFWLKVSRPEFLPANSASLIIGLAWGLTLPLADLFGGLAAPLILAFAVISLVGARLYPGATMRIESHVSSGEISRCRLRNSPSPHGKFRPRLEPFQQVGNSNVKRISERLERLQCDVRLAPFDLPNMRAVQAGAVGHHVLRPAMRQA